MHVHARLHQPRPLALLKDFSVSSHLLKSSTRAAQLHLLLTSVFTHSRMTHLLTAMATPQLPPPHPTPPNTQQTDCEEPTTNILIGQLERRCAFTCVGHWLLQEAISTLAWSSADVNVLQRVGLGLVPHQRSTGQRSHKQPINTDVHSRYSTVILQWQRCRTIWLHGGQLPG